MEFSKGINGMRLEPILNDDEDDIAQLNAPLDTFMTL